MKQILQRTIDALAALIGAGVIFAAGVLTWEGGPLSSGLALLVAGLALLPFIPIPGRGSRSTIFVVAIALAIGLPVMDSVKRHRQTQAAVGFAFDAAQELTKAAVQDGRWPTDLVNGLPDRISVPSDGFERDLVLADCRDQSCSLVVTMQDARYDSRLRGHSFALWTVDGGKTWGCGPAGERPALQVDMPSSCRLGDDP
ncbi:MAG TPA: hypothetical protein VLV87_11575 [Gammaproteobacteria bacterium]|nr:hypothetical protein [Gammaproteobacteria bacterium]